MAFAHGAGVVHRDIKPSNILLKPSAPGVSGSIQLESADFPVLPLLSDFGIAHSTDSPELTHVGRTVGTPAYMAPEQCAGNRVVDGRADIYSLCTVLYRCVVGHLPFSGTTTQLLHAHVYAPLTIDDDILRQLPPSVVDIMRRGLAKSPDDRYPDADALADELALAAGRRMVVTSAEASASNASELTGTLTLSSVGAVAGTQTPRSQSILVPATRAVQSSLQPVDIVSDSSRPGTPDSSGRRPAADLMPEPAPRSAKRLEQFNWIGYGLSTLAALVLVIGGTLAALNLPQLLDRLQPLPDLMGDAVPLSGDPGNPDIPDNAGNFGDPNSGNPESANGPVLVAVVSSATPTQPSQPTAELEGAATPFSDFLNALTPEPVLPTATLAPTATLIPVDTETPVATSTSMATLASTASPDQTDIATPALPTPSSPTPEPVSVAITVSQPISASPTVLVPPPIDDDVIFACTSVIDPAFLQYVGGMPESGGPGFRCPNAEAARAGGRLLRFEHGFMLDLENSPSIYIYYDANQEWERAVSSWRDGDPPKTGEFEPPAPGLFQPENAFGQLWADPWRQIALGFATTEQPATFSAVEQTFPAGALVGDESNGFIYLFLREKLRL